MRAGRATAVVLVTAAAVAATARAGEPSPARVLKIERKLRGADGPPLKCVPAALTQATTRRLDDRDLPMDDSELAAAAIACFAGDGRECYRVALTYGTEKKENVPQVAFHQRACDLGFGPSCYYLPRLMADKWGVTVEQAKELDARACHLSCGGIKVLEEQCRRSGRPYCELDDIDEYNRQHGACPRH